MRWAVVLLLSILVSHVLGQDGVIKPLVEYSERPALYLKRLHHKDKGGSHEGELAFRLNYPGGFSAWQRDARSGLVELLGLEQIKRDTGRNEPVVKLEDPVKEEGYNRRLGSIETEPGVTIPFWLLTPDGESSAPRPLAICVHGHDVEGWIPSGHGIRRPHC